LLNTGAVGAGLLVSTGCVNVTSGFGGTCVGAGVSGIDFASNFGAAVKSFI